MSTPSSKVAGSLVTWANATACARASARARTPLTESSSGSVVREGSVVRASGWAASRRLDTGASRTQGVLPNAASSADTFCVSGSHARPGASRR